MGALLLGGGLVHSAWAVPSTQSMSGQFRFSYFTDRYEETLAFYREGLELPDLESWDRNPDDRGTLFVAASGMIEVLFRPRGEARHVWDARPAQGAFMVIEMEQVDTLFQNAVEKRADAVSLPAAPGPLEFYPPNHKPRR